MDRDKATVHTTMPADITKGGVYEKVGTADYLIPDSSMVSCKNSIAHY